MVIVVLQDHHQAMIMPISCYSKNVIYYDLCLGKAEGKDSYLITESTFQAE